MLAIPDPRADVQSARARVRETLALVRARNAKRDPDSKMFRLRRTSLERKAVVLPDEPPPND